MRALLLALALLLSLPLTSAAQVGGGVYAPPMGYTPFSGVIIKRAVNFNAANTDNAIPIVLPPGSTRYFVSSLRIANASASLASSTFGLYTDTAAGGTALITAATAATITSTTAGAVNSAQTVGGAASVNVIAFSYATQPTLYFRTIAASAAAATADVAVTIIFMP